MTILFWLYKSRKNKLGESPIHVRITIDSVREQFSTGLSVQPKNWNKDKQLVKGASREAELKNNELERLKLELRTAYGELRSIHPVVTARQVRNRFTGEKSTNALLLEVYREHNLELKQLIGITRREGTYRNFQASYNTLASFVEEKLKEKDVALRNLTIKFIRDFSIYLQVDRKMANPTAHKNLQRLQKVVTFAIMNDQLDKDPFLRFKFKLERTAIKYLTKEELKRIEEKELPIERLDRIRDYFIFCCYTGLSYGDIASLRKDQIREGVDGELWIFGKRNKTGTEFRVPMLPKAIELSQKHSNDTDFVFDIPTNVRMNAYLKEIADLCGIKQNLCTHLARKTFASTVTLLNGVPMETVSKMLGHNSIRVTESAYAKVLDEKIGMDMKHLRDNSS